MPLRKMMIRVSPWQGAGPRIQNPDIECGAAHFAFPDHCSAHGKFNGSRHHDTAREAKFEIRTHCSLVNRSFLYTTGAESSPASLAFSE